MTRMASDIAGLTFSRWTVLRRGTRKRHWLCRCACGTLREVADRNLQYGSSRSCGCLLKGEQHRHVHVMSRLLSMPERREVLASFRRACAAGEPITECYRAGIETVQRLRPDYARQYAGMRATEVILEHRMRELMQ